MRFEGQVRSAANKNEVECFGAHLRLRRQLRCKRVAHRRQVARGSGCGPRRHAGCSHSTRRQAQHRISARGIERSAPAAGRAVCEAEDEVEAREQRRRQAGTRLQVGSCGSAGRGVASGQQRACAGQAGAYACFGAGDALRLEGLVQRVALRHRECAQVIHSRNAAVRAHKRARLKRPAGTVAHRRCGQAGGGACRTRGEGGAASQARSPAQQRAFACAGIAAQQHMRLAAHALPARAAAWHPARKRERERQLGSRQAVQRRAQRSNQGVTRGQRARRMRAPIWRPLRKRVGCGKPGWRWRRVCRRVSFWSTRRQ